MVAASSLVDALLTQAMVVVVVGAIAGSRHCHCLVDNAGGHWMMVGMGMGVIASSPSMLGMVMGVVIVIVIVGGHIDDTGDVGGRVITGDRHRHWTMLGMGAWGVLVVRWWSHCRWWPCCHGHGRCHHWEPSLSSLMVVVASMTLVVVVGVIAIIHRPWWSHHCRH